MNIIEQRARTHGSYEQVAALSQSLKDALRSGKFGALPSTHRESLDMICVKMARIICGDHNEPDHYRDICGYSELILRTLDGK